MNRLPIDPEEMASRVDEDFIASLNMLGEGAPIFASYSIFEEEEEVKAEKQELPETYQ